MGAEAESQRYRSLLSSVGKGALNALFPNDFEYYVVALELTDSRDETVDYFVFPVTPSSISIDNTMITNVKKSAGGITSLSSSTFIPRNIALKGDFGRKLRVLMGGNISIGPKTIEASTTGGAFSRASVSADIPVAISFNNFVPNIKTGYGSIRVLSAIYDKSVGIDKYNLPYKLYFYNPAQGESFLVKAKNLAISQNYQNNMIWNYDLSMVAVAPVDQIKKDAKGSLLALTAFDNLEKGVSAFASEAYDGVKNIATSESVKLPL